MAQMMRPIILSNHEKNPEKILWPVLERRKKTQKPNYLTKEQSNYYTADFQGPNLFWNRGSKIRKKLKRCF